VLKIIKKYKMNNSELLKIKSSQEKLEILYKLELLGKRIELTTKYFYKYFCDLDIDDIISSISNEDDITSHMKNLLEIHKFHNYMIPRTTEIKLPPIHHVDKKIFFNLKDIDWFLAYFGYRSLEKLDIKKNIYVYRLDELPSTCHFRHNKPCLLTMRKILDKKPCCESCISIKRAVSVVIKHGEIHPQKCPKIKKKTSETYNERYKPDGPLRKRMLQRRMETNMERYKVPWPLMNKENQTKAIETCMKNFGVPNAMQNENVREILKQSNIKKRGVPYPMQDPEVAEKSNKKSHKYKEYVLPSGNIVYLQGYEPHCLNDLLEIFAEDQIKITKQINEMGIEIWYYYEDLNRRYFPDIYIPDLNLIIEVKSYFTFEKQKSKNLEKAEACKKLGFNYEIHIYEKNGELQEIIEF
jgi:hypothetical protein